MANSQRKRIWNPLWNRKELRLRALWRLLLFSACAMGLEWLGQQYVARYGWPRGPLPILGATVVYPLSLWLMSRYIDRRSWRDYGLALNRNWLIDCLFGALLGALLMGLVFGLELALGWIEIVSVMQNPTSTSFASSMAFCAAIYMLVSWREETLTRGYLMLNLAQGLRPGPTTHRIAVLLAWVISSVIFGLLHAANPHATYTSTLYLMIAGLMLGLPYLLTGSLAIPIGLHFSWNLVQGHVFGFPISGMRIQQATVFQIRQLGPAAWTGAAFGPEAGYLGLIVMLLCMVLMCLWIQWRYGRVRVQQELADYSCPVESTR